MFQSERFKQFYITSKVVPYKNYMLMAAWLVKNAKSSERDDKNSGLPEGGGDTSTLAASAPPADPSR